VGNPAGADNIYFTQYKRWEPQGDSTDFALAENWGGGTQFSSTDVGEALNWNTGPALNWLATIANDTGGTQNVEVSADAQTMALELRGDAGPVVLDVQPGVALEARNGFRISSGGAIRLHGGELNTIRRLDVREGGMLHGHGTITGQQHLLAGIAEFEEQGLLEPELVNAGSIQIDGGVGAGILSVEGKFRQLMGGVLEIDLLGNGGTAGVDFDQLRVSDSVELAGTIAIDMAPEFRPARGDTFEVVKGATVATDRLRLGGPDGAFFAARVRDVGTDVVTAVKFDFTGVQDDAPLTQTSVQSENAVVSHGLDFGPGLSPHGRLDAGDEFHVSGFRANAPLTNAIFQENYLTFSVEPIEGTALIPSSVSFDLWRHGEGAPTDWAILSSLDGFTEDVVVGQFTTTEFGVENPHTLTAMFGDTEALTDPLEIRLYGWNGNGHVHVTGASLDAQFVSVAGTSLGNASANPQAVPEPASAALVILGIAATGLLKRRVHWN
ncbi:MAG: PEP-CTERM sorting domain-containing protein, partial [Planctomycetota bacterium]